jgi:ubiquinone/menaquinone biosynthesis C-methylase UbiE
MEYPDWLLDVIRCPETGERLRAGAGGLVRIDGFQYPLKDGILSLVYPRQLEGQDERWNRFYDSFAPFYDASERFFGKLLLGVDIREAWKRTARLAGLKPGMRMLEVSPGPGVYQPFLREAIGETGELVSLDLSLAMLRQCRKLQPRLRTHLIQGNGSRLPFADGSFDALFHFGGVNLFHEPQKAVEEFVRVVRGDGVVCWGDEGMSAKIPAGWKKEILIRMNPGYLRPKPTTPDTLENVQKYEIYGGYGYLLVGTKRNRPGLDGHGRTETASGLPYGSPDMTIIKATPRCRMPKEEST